MHFNITMMSICRVFSCVVGRRCLLWPVCSFGKTLLVLALLYLVLQGQISLLLQCQGTFNFKGSNMFSSLCAISQGLSVPYQFLENRNEQSFIQFSELRSWEREPGWISFSNSLQWLSSVTFYLKDYPFCCNWWNFILFNAWVIILFI